MCSCFPVYRRAAFWPERWHLAQRLGTLREKVGEFESILPRMPWLPWHSRQSGASGLPLAANCPCVLWRFWAIGSAWQIEQSTLAITVLHGRSSEGVQDRDRQGRL